MVSSITDRALATQLAVIREVFQLLIAFLLSIALIATILAAPIVDGSVVIKHAIYLLSALALACSAAAVAPAEISTAISRLRRFAPAIAFPIIWMLVQIAPFPSQFSVNPIWTVTAVALNEPSLSNRISVDPGATLDCLAWYLTILSIMISTVLLTTDRRRAEIAFLILIGAASIIALEGLAGRLDFLAAIAPNLRSVGDHSLLLAGPIAVLGNATAIVMAIGQHKNRPDIGVSSTGSLLLRIVLNATGLAAGLTSIAIFGTSSLLGVTGLGLTVIAFIAIVRRSGLSSLQSAVLAGIVLMVGAAAVLSMQSAPALKLMNFAQSTTPDSVAIAQRALSDTPWPGAGVGTFEQIGRVYLDYAETQVPAPPSTAILVAIEWGTPALAVLIISALQIFFATLRGAIDRGRDSLYSATTAGIIMVSLIAAFMDTGLLNLEVQLLLGGLLGLGIAQSAGRTSAR